MISVPKYQSYTGEVLTRSQHDARLVLILQIDDPTHNWW